MRRHAAEERLELARREKRAGRVVRIGDEHDARLPIDRLQHRREIVGVVAGRHDDAPRAACLRRERIHRERMLRIDGGASRSEERDRDHLEDVVRAVAEHDAFMRHAIARRERGFQLEAVAVGIAAELRQRGGDRARARGEIPSGFSLDASLMIVVSSSPSSRASSEIGLPGW